MNVPTKGFDGQGRYNGRGRYGPSGSHEDIEMKGGRVVKFKDLFSVNEHGKLHINETLLSGDELRSIRRSEFFKHRLAT
jgi:hypothetical protein